MYDVMNSGHNRPRRSTAGQATFQRPAVVTTVAELRRTVAAWRTQGERVALVPTMGALHEGHLSLVGIGHALCERVVVSIFVNPTQFAPSEDFDKYPRQPDADLDLLGSVGTDLAFIPAVREMYPRWPERLLTTVHVGALSDGLETRFRPGHFDGVATVVAKLLLQCLPDAAIFGEKDYQQLQVIRRMVADLDIPVDIVPGPTIRDAHGLALSSRNAYLSAEQSRIARRLNQVLFALARQFEQNPDSAHIGAWLDWGRQELADAGFDSVDYLELRDADSLASVTTLAKPARLLAATRLGGIRLIDNIAVPAQPAPPA
ncbi:MAG: pantoate--beta-alanine ligase [Gammaproteobacteria bacterium]